MSNVFFCFFFFQAEDGIRDWSVTGVQTCALPISSETAEPAAISSTLAAMIDKLQTWMTTLTDRERALLDHYTYGASWEEVVAELTKLGAPVSISTARVQGHRLIKRAQQELGLQIED